MAKRIIITPEMLNLWGHELIGYTGDLSNILNNIDIRMNKIRAVSWLDNSSEDAYFQRYTMLKEDAARLEELIKEFGERMIEVARMVEIPDEEIENNLAARFRG